MQGNFVVIKHQRISLCEL